MTVIKSYSVKLTDTLKGDMFTIKHGSDNFTIIDCCLSEDDKDTIIQDIKLSSKDKKMRRFISTHPDEDHIRNLDYLDDKMHISNFYCVKNNATKKDESDSFKRYCELRDSSKACFLEKNITRKWLNLGDSQRGSSGISIKWPIVENEHFKKALQKANDGGSPNNISPIIYYRLQDGVTATWMGDLETDFMEEISESINLPKTNILFAPHHGRDSGKVPKYLLDNMAPDLIIIGEAPSKHLNYYAGYCTITQNSAKDITFFCTHREVHVYVSNENYSKKEIDCLKNKDREDMEECYYLGTLNV